jgi:uncharacterized protein YhfF
MTDQEAEAVQPDEDAIAAFWVDAKRHAHLDTMPGYFGPSALESMQPPSWWFGGTPDEADGLLDRVLTGAKTATCTLNADYEAAGEPLPEAGTMSILLDGSGRPRALLVTTAVRVVSLGEVDAAHVDLEGADSLPAELPVVLEHFEVLHRA